MKTDTLDKDLSATTDIKHRIMLLNQKRAMQEEVLKHDMREVIHAFTPTTIIKNTVQDLKQDPGFRRDAITHGISVGAGFLVDALVFRKGFGLKSSLISAGLKKVISHFVNKRKNA